MTSSKSESIVIENFTRRVLGNAGAMLGSEIFARVGVFAAYILVARRFDTDSFAELSLGLAFFLTARTIAAAGIQTQLTREVSKNWGRRIEPADPRGTDRPVFGDSG
jgi:O-antigen/teichoic acid export membrane protein